MKNNIKKAPVTFWEDLLYFQHFMQIFLLQISNYHHFNQLSYRGFLPHPFTLSTKPYKIYYRRMLYFYSYLGIQLP